MTNKSSLQLHPNVIDGEELEALFAKVFGDMSKYVSRTYGPYGENTGYQLRDKILMTKDGWKVEQEFTYSKNLLANIVRKIIIDVSNAINLHAGDGTSTGLIVANAINTAIIEYKKKEKIHSKVLTRLLKKSVNLICMELQDLSKPITDENLNDIIYKIALIALDWDKELAGFICDIYKKTGNPFIRVVESGTNKSSVEYVSGYDISGSLVTDIKINEVANRRCVIKSPKILIFDFSVPGEMFEGLCAYLSTVANKYDEDGNPPKEPREIVILAPGFARGFENSYAAFNAAQIRNNKAPLPFTLARFATTFNIDWDMVHDVGVLVGATPVTQDNVAFTAAIRDYGDLIMASSSMKKEEFVGVQQETMDRINAAKIEFGECEEITIDDKTIVVSGFTKLKDNTIIEKRRNIIKSEIEAKRREFDAKSMMADDIRLKELRLSKLGLMTGIIKVGGYGEDTIRSTKDALDDAINACSLVYTGGYNIGGNIGVLIAINRVIEKVSTETDIATEQVALTKLLNIIKEGFMEATRIMYNNKYGDSHTKEDYDNIIEKCCEKESAWNLITDAYDKKLYQPTQVDIEVVKGCLHLVLTTTTMNQLFYHGYEGINEELQGMREVPVQGVEPNPLDKLK